MSARVVSLAVLSLQLFLVAKAAAAQATPRWSIGDTPLLSIGSSDGDTTLEVHLGNSAVRLGNGEIVVASSRNQRLQWYDARGRLVRTIGRRGQGPGEFLGTVLVYADRGDSVLAYDAGNRRWQRFSPTGRLVRVDTTVDVRRVQWMFDRTVVRRAPLGTDFQALTSTLSRLPAVPPDSIRVARVDHRGYVWDRSPTDARTYTIHDPQGRRAASVAVPADFDLYEIGDSAVLGRWKDADGFEFIQLRRLTRAAGSTAAPSAPRATYDQANALRTGAELVALMRSTLRRIATAQEAFFADFAHYATSVEELSRFARVVVPQGMKVAIIGAQRGSFALVATHGGTPLSCAVVLDSEKPPRDVEVCG